LLRAHFESTTLVTSGMALLASVRVNPPEVLVADFSMPGISGIDAMRQVAADGYDMPFVFLTMHDDPSLAAAAVRLGGRGFIDDARAG
jgi:DNA-binding NarL/FixJ family response regulator